MSLKFVFYFILFIKKQMQGASENFYTLWLKTSNFKTFSNMFTNPIYGNKSNLRF